MKMWVYFITVWNILRPFAIIYGRLVCLDQEKSGNPARYCKEHWIRESYFSLPMK
jgi:hypothetical protein